MEKLTQEIEHKLPLINGGDNSSDNLVVSCHACNVKKGRLTAEEFLERLA